MFMKPYYKYPFRIIRDFLGNLFGITEQNNLARKICLISLYEARNNLLSLPRYSDDKRLVKYGFQVYSQADEDGIIQEIFRRIGIKHRSFLEFGASPGLGNNTLYLLMQGWRGAWIDADSNNINRIKKRMAKKIENGQLKVKCAFMDRNNANSVIETLIPEKEIDLLSIDIDGNDYHLLDKLEAVSARVVVVEYNAKFPPPVEWVIKYDSGHTWDGTDYFGASLASYEKLFTRKGYSLVGCNINGTNAFFVRQDLVDEHFCQPFTAENHYEPARYWLYDGIISGHSYSHKIFTEG
jgi:hypothetical protein